MSRAECDEMERRFLFPLNLVFVTLLIILISFCLSACDDVETDYSDYKAVLHFNNGAEESIKHLDDDISKPEFEGHKFQGWYIDSEFTQSVAIETLNVDFIERNSNLFNNKIISLYAKWADKVVSDGITLLNKTYVYDGNEHQLFVENLPSGASAEFVGDYKFKDAGEYEIVCNVSHEDFGTVSLTGKLTITKAKFNSESVTFKSESFRYDGETHSVYILGDLPDGIGVTYIGNGQVDVGEYTVTAKFDTGKNYEAVADKTATLKILANAVTLTFKNGEETVGTVTVDETSNENTVSIPTVPAKRGYAGSWSVSDFLNIKEDAEIYTVYVPITYLVDYNLNGGSGISQGSYTVEDEIDLPLPTRDNCAFGGWYDIESGEKVVKIERGSVGNRTLIARWVGNRYEITYDLAGGLQNAKNPTGYNFGDEDIELFAPTKSGYTFVAFQDEDGKAVSVISASSAKNYTLTAVWRANEYAINYILNGGEFVSTAPTKHTAGVSVALPVPSKRGYRFTEWSLNGKVVTSIDGDVHSDVTVTALWEIVEYSVSYNLAGGRFTSSAVATYTVEDDEITLQTPVKKGYEFVKWTDENGEVITVISTQDARDRTVTANWNVINYSITYDLGGGEIDGEYPVSYNIESDVTLPVPVKSGYNFVKWTEDGSAVTDVDTSLCRDIRLVAVWEEVVLFTVSNGEITACSYAAGTDVVIPESVNGENVTAISSGVLNEATGVEIQANVTSLENVFKNCSKLEKIVLNENAPLSDGMFEGCTNLKTLTVPRCYISGSKSNEFLSFAALFGKTASDNADKVDVNSTLFVGGCAQANQSYSGDERYVPKSLKSVTVLGGDVYIGAFEGFASLKSVDLNNANLISTKAFNCCSSLERLFIGGSDFSLSQSALLQCCGLRDVSLTVDEDKIDKIKESMSSAFKKANILLKNILINGMQVLLG